MSVLVVDLLPLLLGSWGVSNVGLLSRIGSLLLHVWIMYAWLRYRVWLLLHHTWLLWHTWLLLHAWLLWHVNWLRVHVDWLTCDDLVLLNHTTWLLDMVHCGSRLTVCDCSLIVGGHEMIVHMM